MASITPYKDGYRAQVRHGKARKSKTFRTKREAQRWALRTEATLSIPDTHKPLSFALTRFKDEVSPKRDGGEWEVKRINALLRDPLADVPMDELTDVHVQAWVDRRLEKVKPGSVDRELSLVASVFKHCRKPWNYMTTNPLIGVVKPEKPPSRKRRITPDEVDTIIAAFGVWNLQHDTKKKRVGLMFLLGLESAMRAGEMVGLTWNHVHKRHVHLPKTKNGDARDVPLSKRAREILAALPREGDSVFNVDSKSRDKLWRDVRDTTGIADIHFHDSRAEAIWRLSKKLDIYELARAIGHKDLNSLLLYYQTTADELADKLG